MKLRVLVCGGRDYDDVVTLTAVLNTIDAALGIKCIIEGHARGADRMAGIWAVNNGIDTEIYPADWDAHGRRAGYIRNVQMAEEGKPHMIVAFPGGRGTQMMKDIGKKKNIPVYRHDEWI